MSCALLLIYRGWGWASLFVLLVLFLDCFQNQQVRNRSPLFWGFTPFSKNSLNFKSVVFVCSEESCLKAVSYWVLDWSVATVNSPWLSALSLCWIWMAISPYPPFISMSLPFLVIDKTAECKQCVQSGFSGWIAARYADSGSLLWLVAGLSCQSCLSTPLLQIWLVWNLEDIQFRGVNMK